MIEQAPELSTLCSVVIAWQTRWSLRLTRYRTTREHKPTHHYTRDYRPQLCTFACKIQPGLRLLRLRSVHASLFNTCGYNSDAGTRLHTYTRNTFIPENAESQSGAIRILSHIRTYGVSAHSCFHCIQTYTDKYLLARKSHISCLIYRQLIPIGSATDTLAAAALARQSVLLVFAN